MGSNTVYNSTFGNSTFNRTNNKTITLKFSEKTLKLQNESQSRLAELCFDNRDKSSIGVGFYKNALTTNKLGKYLRPKSRLIKMSDDDVYNPDVSSNLTQGQAQLTKRSYSNSGLKPDANESRKSAGFGLKQKSRHTHSMANMAPVSRISEMN